VVNLSPGSWPNGLERNGGWVPWLLIQQVRHVPVSLEWNAVEFVSNAEVQCKVVPNLPGILDERAVLMLDESAEICRPTLPFSGKKLRLGLNTRYSEQCRRHCLKRVVVSAVAAAVHNRNTKVSESGEID
jgi:hypothetical protein